MIALNEARGQPGMSALSVLLNLLWIIFGGLWMAAGWMIAAVVMAITIIACHAQGRLSTSLFTRCCPLARKPFHARPMDITILAPDHLAFLAMSFGLSSPVGGWRSLISSQQSC